MREKRNSSQAKYGEVTKVIRLPETLANFLQQYPSVINELVSQIKDGAINLSIDVTARNTVTGSQTYDFERMIYEAIAPLLARLDALETNRTEATALANSQGDESNVPETDGSTENVIELDTPPIIQEIKPIATPSVEKFLDSNTLSKAIAATDKPKATKRSARSKALLTRPEALEIAKNFGFNGSPQNLYDWAKAALTAKSDESKTANSEKLAAVGLIAVLSPENKPAWTAKTQS